MTSPNEILKFWFEEITPEEQFMGSTELDDRIRDRFGAAWKEANSGGLADWMDSSDGALALIIMLDQFPRNMFRGSGRSFESDARALKYAGRAIEAGLDMQQPERRRLFIYMPYMHSERIADQERCIELIAEKLPETGAINHVHARAHRDIIKLFGRFPYRNEALGRDSTPAETEWVEKVGYRKFVELLQEADES